MKIVFMFIVDEV